MRIRAAVLEEFARPLVVQEVELAEPRQDEVLVRLATTTRPAADLVAHNPRGATITFAIGWSGTVSGNKPDDIFSE
jgi:Zn-dependent alcohol dehydrogenase